jgi:hypothetical protein
MNFKKISKSLIVSIMTIFLGLVTFTDSAVAAGGPYGPYGPHIPEPTGFMGITDILITTGIISYLIGLLLISYSQKLKQIIHSE